MTAVPRALSVGATLALLGAYAALCFVYLSVFSPGVWVGGVVVSTVVRVGDGGAMYDTGGTLLGPTWPYFPGIVLLARALAAVGVPVLLLPVLIGSTSVLALPVVAAGVARAAGARWWPALAVSLCLHALAMTRYHTFEMMAAGAFPDALVAELLLGTCLVVARIERSGTSSWREKLALGAVLVAAGLSKQVGVAGVVGTFAYLVLGSRLRGRPRGELLGVVAASGAIVLAVVLATPGCFHHTVVVIGRHARDWSRLGVLVEHLVGWQLLALLLYAACLPAVRRASDEVRHLFACSHAILLPVIVVQVLATVKEGGGGQWDSYNMELVVSLLLPVPVWALATLVNRARPVWQAGVLAVVAAVGATASLDARGRTVARRDGAAASVAATVAELHQLARPGLAFAHESEAWALYRAGFRLATGTSALWHYAVADPTLQDPRWLEGLERALRERRYAVIQPTWMQSLPDAVVERLRPSIDAGYTPALDGRWLVPRPEP